MFQSRERLWSDMGDEQEKLLDEALGIVKVTGYLQSQV